MLIRPKWCFAVAACGFWLAAAVATGQTMRAAKLDEFGNPVGDVGLAARNAFKGRRLVAWTIEAEVLQNIYPDDNPLWKALRDKGFHVDLKQGSFEPKWLRGADQLWLFAGRSPGIDDAGIAAIEKFVRSGHGLYLVADNDPLVCDATTICERLFGASISGNYKGDEIIAIRGHGVTRDDFRKSSMKGGIAKEGSSGEESEGGAKPRPKLPGLGARMEVIDRASHYADDHALMTGLNFLYEGWTISHVGSSAKLQTVLTASDGQILAAISKDPKLHVLVDCGWTRYWTRFVTKTAGTVRYAENVAAWLMGASRRTGGPDDIAALLATLDSGAGGAAERKALEKFNVNPPKFAAVKEQLGEIWRLAASSKPEVAEAARRQVVNAFQRAPIGECLRWLATGDAGLQSLIWQQLDERIARADADRKASYREAALTAIQDKASAAGVRHAAIKLLSRVPGGESAEALIDALPKLPRDAWGPAGKALEKMTGERFGPEPGGGVAELNVAVKKWRAWRAAQGKR